MSVKPYYVAFELRRFSEALIQCSEIIMDIQYAVSRFFCEFRLDTYLMLSAARYLCSHCLKNIEFFKKSWIE